jgi:uncharacterized protein YmfQ (DUF2313 family)
LSPLSLVAAQHRDAAVKNKKNPEKGCASRHRIMMLPRIGSKIKISNAQFFFRSEVTCFRDEMVRVEVANRALPTKADVMLRFVSPLGPFDD